MEIGEFFTHLALVQGGHRPFHEIVVPMHGTQQCGIKLCDIHGYFHRLMVNQWTPKFWSVIVKVHLLDEGYA